MTMEQKLTIDELRGFLSTHDSFIAAIFGENVFCWMFCFSTSSGHRGQQGSAAPPYPDLNSKFTPNKLNSKSDLNKTSSHWPHPALPSSPVHTEGRLTIVLEIVHCIPSCRTLSLPFPVIPPEQSGWCFTSRHWNILKLSKCRKRGFLCLSNQQPCAQILRDSEN